MLIFFCIFVHGIFAQKIKLCWKFPVLNKKHLILLHIFGSQGVSSCRKILAFSTFFSGIGERKTSITTQLTYFYVLNETEHSTICFFCFCSWIDWNWEETWFFNGTIWSKNPPTDFRTNQTSFLLLSLACVRSWSSHRLFVTFLSSENLMLSLWLHLA